MATVSKEKKRPWFADKIELQNKKIAELENELQNKSSTVGSDDFNIDSYVKGFFECMCNYGILTKISRRVVCKNIKERYKGDGDTNYVRKVRR